ncbi:MAG: DUF5688 family protein [Parasporobacterium sp.]|nr:DUF5688 family protein [Parasporobacterium sp.]
MNYNEFLDALLESVESLMGEEYDISYHDILKNNDNSLKAMIIKKEGDHISPTIYLKGFYEDYIYGKSTLFDIRDEIIRLYKDNCNDVSIDAQNYENFDYIKSKIAYKLVNAKSNENMLKDVPWIPILDLAIVFYVIVKIDKSGADGTILIKNNHLKIWGIDKEELIELAKENTPKIMPSEIRTMKKVISDILKKRNIKVSEYDLPLNDYFSEDMFVISNKKMLFGAAALIYDGVLEELSENIDEDLYILPSSIHEVIVLPCRNGDEERFNNMVKAVNREELAASDVLSDHIYRYSRKEKALQML